MPCIEHVRSYYSRFDAKAASEFWAARWGATDMQWYGTILPRIHAFLPAHRILEIGAGPGRLSKFLLEHCRELILVDISEAFLEVCRQKFATEPTRVVCHLTDGCTLGRIEPLSIDFAFSFYSLIHADCETLQGLFGDLEKVLSQDGVAFIHHSNAMECLTDDGSNAEVVDLHQDPTVGASLVRNMCHSLGLECRSQELIGWDSNERLTDCFTVVTRPWTKHSMAQRLITNKSFLAEVESLRRLSKTYANLSYAY